MNKAHTQQGFTLIELLVVISVLAAMAGIAVTAIDSYDDEARDQLAQVEMHTIANAIYRFKQDTGYFPEEGVFSTAAGIAHQSNLDFLFESPINASNNEILPWNPAVARGWNGPYLTPDSQQRLHYAAGSPTSSDCALVAVNMGQSFPALEDPYEQSQAYAGSEDCFAIHNRGNWVAKRAAGQPYRYLLNFTHASYPDCPTGGSGCVVLLSAGKDGQFNSVDDLVTILRKNG